MRVQQIEAAHRGLIELLQDRPSVSLGIREGVLFDGEEVIFNDDDDRNGPTYILAAHSIFELSFEAGVTLDELTTLVSILSEQPGFTRRGGEDLVTLIWRHDLRNIRHHWVDVLASAVQADPTSQRPVNLEDSEMDRLRRELAGIVSALAVDEARGTDVILLHDRALETPELCRHAIDHSQRQFAHAVALNERRISKRTLDALRLELRTSVSHEALAARLADLLIHGLLIEPDPLAPSTGLTLLMRLFRGMLEESDFGSAAKLVLRFRELATTGAGAPASTPPTTVRAFGRTLLAEVCTRESTAAAVKAMDAAERRLGVRAPELLRAIGPEGVPSLVAELPAVENQTAREQLIELAVELAAEHPHELHPLMRSERPEVAGQLLRAASRLSSDDRAPLIALGLSHPQAQVRATALRGLADYDGARPDELFTRALGDPDPKVRAHAIRTLAARNSATGARALGILAARDDLFDREPSELRLILVARAKLLGAAAVPELDRFLSKVSALTKGHKAATIEAVALALSVIDAAPARELLDKGARSLNPRLRSACKLALETGGAAEVHRVLGSSESSVDQVLASFTAGEAPRVRSRWPAEAELELGRGRSAGRTSLLPAPPQRVRQSPSTGLTATRPAPAAAHPPIPSRRSSAPPPAPVPPLREGGRSSAPPPPFDAIAPGRGSVPPAVDPASIGLTPLEEERPGELRFDPSRGWIVGDRPEDE